MLEYIGQPGPAWSMSTRISVWAFPPLGGGWQMAAPIVDLVGTCLEHIQMYECYESLWVIYSWSIVGNCWKLKHVAREVYLNPSDPLASRGSGGSSKTKCGFCWPRGPRGSVGFPVRCQVESVAIETMNPSARIFWEILWRILPEPTRRHYFGQWMFEVVQEATAPNSQNSEMSLCEANRRRWNWLISMSSQQTRRFGYSQLAVDLLGEGIYPVILMLPACKLT